jgi:hypothetical protein
MLPIGQTMSMKLSDEPTIDLQRSVALDNSTLQQLEKFVASAVEKALAASAEFRPSQISNRLAFNEAEAASLLGVKSHVVRDARLRGEISSTRVGGRIAYTRDDLLHYLENQKG